MLEYNEFQYHNNAEMDKLLYKFSEAGKGKIFFVNSKFWFGHGKFAGKLRTDRWLTISEFIPQINFLELNNLNVEAAIWELSQYLAIHAFPACNVAIVFPPGWDKRYFNNQMVNGMPGDYKIKVLYNDDELLIIDEGDVEKREWERKNDSLRSRKYY